MQYDSTLLHEREKIKKDPCVTCSDTSQVLELSDKFILYKVF